MKDSVLVQTLVMLSKEEWEQLDAFLDSSFFHQGSHYNQNIALYDLLKDAIQKNKIESLNRVGISHVLFKNKKNYNNHYLDNRMSELLAIVKKYIAFKMVNSRWGRSFEEVACSWFYRNRNQPKLAEQIALKTRKSISKNNIQSEDNLMVLYWLNDELLKLENFNNQRRGDLNIPETIESLSKFYATKLLEINLIQMQQHRVVPDFQPQWLPLITDMGRIFQDNNFFNSSTLHLLYEASILMDDQAENPVAQLKKYTNMLDAHEEQISKDTISNLATIARSYCTRKINQGNNNFNNIRLNLYKKHLKKGWLYENDKLTPSTFINLINLSLSLDAKDWAEDLLVNYAQKVVSVNRVKIINYCFGLYHCHFKQIKAARTYLNKLKQSGKLSDTDFENLIRIFEIKVLFEEDDEFILTQLHNFLMFIRRGKKSFPDKVRPLFIEFKKMTEKIFKLKHQIRQKGIADKSIRTKLKSFEQSLVKPTVPIAEVSWLLKKVKELDTTVS